MPYEYTIIRAVHEVDKQVLDFEIFGANTNNEEIVKGIATLLAREACLNYVMKYKGKLSVMPLALCFVPRCRWLGYRYIMHSMIDEYEKDAAFNKDVVRIAAQLDSVLPNINIYADEFRKTMSGADCLWMQDTKNRLTNVIAAYEQLSDCYYNSKDYETFIAVFIETGLFEITKREFERSQTDDAECNK